MSKRWRCAVIGTGGVGNMHVQAIERLPNCELAAVCDVIPERMDRVLGNVNRPEVPKYTDYRDLLRREQVNLVHICTPSGNHMDPSIVAMEAGADVICEKPMEIRLDRIDRMIETAQKRNVKLSSIFQLRWIDENIALKRAAEEGRFGRIAYAGCFTPWFRSDAYYSQGGWRGTWELDGGGAIMNQSIHMVDLLQWIAGPVRQVSAYASSRIHPDIEVEDTLVCALTFENGAHGVIQGSTGMWPGRPVRIEIGGENGTAVAEEGLKMYRFREEREQDKALIERINSGRLESTVGAVNPADVPVELHRRNIEGILGFWEAGREADTWGPEARKAVAIILAMYESARRDGAPVKVG